MKLIISIVVVISVASALLFLNNREDKDASDQSASTTTVDDNINKFSSDEFQFSFEYDERYGNLESEIFDYTGDDCIISEPDGPRRECDGKVLSIQFSGTSIAITAATSSWFQSIGPIPEAYLMIRGFTMVDGDIVFNAAEGFTTDGVVPNARFNEDLQAVIAEGTSNEAMGDDNNTYYAKNTSIGGVLITVPEDSSIEQAEQLVRSLSVN